MLGFMRRSTQDFTGITTLKTLYCSLVRPHLEYASCVWSPFYGVHIETLCHVEHKFLKQVAFKLNILENYNDEDLLAILNMPPISIRHKMRKLITFYNILHGRAAASFLLNKINIPVPPRPTRSIASFHDPIIHRTNYGFNNFISRTARLANQYDNIDFFTTFDSFLRQVLCTLGLNNTYNFLYCIV